jgi:chromosome segregation ATPase
MSVNEQWQKDLAAAKKRLQAAKEFKAVASAQLQEANKQLATAKVEYENACQDEIAALQDLVQFVNLNNVDTIGLFN